MSAPATRKSPPRPDPVLYADFLAALTRVIEHGETVSLHGCTISWPKMQPGYWALRVETRRTVRCPWTGALSYAVGLGGGDASRPKYVAKHLAFELVADRALRARLLAEAKPGILSGTVTHEAA